MNDLERLCFKYWFQELHPVLVINDILTSEVSCDYQNSQFLGGLNILYFKVVEPTICEVDQSIKS